MAQDGVGCKLELSGKKGLKVDDGDSRTFSQGNSGTDLWMETLAMTVSLLFTAK